MTRYSTGGPPPRSRIAQGIGLAILGWGCVGALWLAVEAVAWIVEMAG